MDYLEYFFELVQTIGVRKKKCIKRVPVLPMQSFVYIILLDVRIELKQPP